MSEASEQLGRAAAEEVARRSYGKLIAFLAMRTRDVAAAEDALSEAFAMALSQWPESGVPERPESWLATVALRKLIDSGRRAQTSNAAAADVALVMTELTELESAAMDSTRIPDERLGLMFACAHPAIDPATRAPLILQTILGFDAATIAAAFLVSPATMGQRLVRAKTKIRQAGIPFRVPDRADMPERVDAVLEAIYGAFAEGWTDPSGTDGRLRELASEAIWIGRLLVSLLPEEPEGLGLLALMLHAEARRGARRTEAGEYVPLSEQDAELWDAALIDEADTLLERAGRYNRIGRYQLEAAVQSAHAVRRFAGRSDWAAIAMLYDALYMMTGSPVVAINRAVAVAETSGPAAGLSLLDAISDDARLAGYQPYWAARAELLARAGLLPAATEAFGKAIALESDLAVRRFLEARQAQLAG
jgi:RNA polymerase sigma-70 factor (ECF subfamily)